MRNDEWSAPSSVRGKARDAALAYARRIIEPLRLGSSGPERCATTIAAQSTLRPLLLDGVVEITGRASHGEGRADAGSRFGLDFFCRRQLEQPPRTQTLRGHPETLESGPQGCLI